MEYTELDIVAYNLYDNHKDKIYSLSINGFVEFKDHLYIDDKKLTHFYYLANIKLRKQKIENINIKCHTQN